ncbi:MAG: hypothetical protein MI862_04310 [Desulfobacterales bacterium]|nr:hypothetical protein [Desulfobacterales bacterium]
MDLFSIRMMRSGFGILVICLLVSADPAGAKAIRNVLVLHSYHQGLQWTDFISSGIKKEFENYDDSIEVHYNYLDTKRIPGEAYFKQLIRFEHYKNQLANIDFEVIIASDNNALRFIVENGDALYPDVPVVFCGINNFERQMLKTKKNITGVVEAIDYADTLDLMLKLHPDRKNVWVVLDRTPTGIAIKKEFDIVAALFSDRLKFIYYQDFTLSEVPEHIHGLGENDIIYLLTFNRDREGRFISYSDGIQIIQQASNVPIYGSWDFYFGRGIVGGMLTSGAAQGAEAAKMAKKILEGTAVEDIPILAKSPNRYMFDYNQMERFGIGLSDLPKDSHVINLPPSFMDLHKRGIVNAFVFILIFTFILSWRFFLQKRRQKALIRTNLELDRRVELQTQTLARKNAELEREIKERTQIGKTLMEKKESLEQALSEVKILSGLLPICSSCKKIRDDRGYWNQIESYINLHSDATFSHGICPNCAERLYPDLFEEGELDKD